MTTPALEPYIARHIKKNHKVKFDEEDINFLNWMTEVEKLVFAKGYTLDELNDEGYQMMKSHWMNLEKEKSVKNMAECILACYGSTV